MKEEGVGERGGALGVGGGRRQGSTALSTQGHFDIAAQRSDHCYIGTQRSGLELFSTLALSAPT